MKRVRVEGELGSGLLLEEGGLVVDPYSEGGGATYLPNEGSRGRVGYGGYEFPCVRLRGLPFECKERQICEFLGIEPVDILLVRRGGRFSGEAYVVLGGSDLVELALCKNEQYMGRRYVEVFRAKKMDYYKAIANEIMDGAPMLQMPTHVPVVSSSSGGPQLGYGTNVIRLRGLPYSVTAVDVSQWFNSGVIELSHRVSPDQILVCTAHGRPTGIGFVEFASAQDARAAMGKHKHLMGNRYIELFISDIDELQKAIRQNNN